MSSPSKSPTMESVDQWSRSIHPHHKASVTDNQQVASASASASAAAAPYSPKEKKPQTLPQPQPLITAPNNVNETASLTTNVVSGEVSDDESIDFSNNQKNAQKDDEFFKSFPPGYRFNPQDDELVVYYLKKKVLNKPLPPNRIREVNLYRHNPETLAEKYERYGEKEWYFFTPRDRKYRNGNRPNRAAGDGYWKATGADKQVRSEGAVVGYRKALVFYRGKPPKGDKTNWIMHEFRVDNPPVRIKRCANDMRLDDWVLCRIYKKVDKNNKIRNREDDCTAQIDSKSMEIEVEIETSNQCDGTIVDPLPEYDHGMTYSNYAYQHFHQVGVPNYQLPNNMVSMNGVMSSTANRMQVPPVAVRAPIMSYNSESMFGPKYIEETSLPEEIFDMKALGNPIYTNNYSGQFMHFDYVLPYPEDIDE